jgi:dTDP-4-dehydrorhamnose 3,5-epimerase
MKVALYDGREGSPTRGVVNEFIIGERNPMLIKIPPLVYHGFKCVGIEEALIVNVPTEAYNYAEPDEYRLPAGTKEIPYDWGLAPGLKHG